VKPCAKRKERRKATLRFHGSCGWSHDAAENAQQRRLSAAISPNEREHFAAVDVEVDSIEDNMAARRGVFVRRVSSAQDSREETAARRMRKLLTNPAHTNNQRAVCIGRPTRAFSCGRDFTRHRQTHFVPA
jgi:hypothetical protein